MKLLFLLAITVTVVFARSNVLRLKPFQCEVEDPAYGPPGPLNLSLHPIFELHVGGSHGELNATGVSNVEAHVDINILLLTATFEVLIPEIEVFTTYESTGWIDARPLKHETVPSGNFTASGDVHVYAKDIKIEGDATLFINIIGNRVSIRILHLNTISFGSVDIDLGHFVIAEQEVDFKEWSENFVTRWNQDFNANKAAVTEKVRQAANVIVGQYTLAELIELIGGGGGDEPCEP